MEDISRLRGVLLASLSGRAGPHGEQELFEELMVCKTSLLNLFKVGSRSQAEQREIEAGKIIVNGKTLGINADFARQVIFLAQHLDCSERYVVGILHSIMILNPNLTPVGYIEAAIVEFHRRRRHLADCLRYILENGILRSEVSPLNRRLHDFARNELISRGENGVSFTTRIFKEVENLGKVIAAAQRDKQNAVSNTTAPSSQGGNPTLGYDILNARVESLKYERRHLAVLLLLIARHGYLGTTEIKMHVEWLAANPTHAMTYYLLTATLAAFDPTYSALTSSSRGTLASDKTLISFMTKQLGPSTSWTEPGLKATLLLKWTLFLTESRHNDPSLEQREGFNSDVLEAQIRDAVQGDAFSYMALMVMQWQHRRGISSVTSFASSLSAEQEQSRELPADDFTPAIFEALEVLVRSLITYASSELRKIKQKQEDVVLASGRSDRTRMFRSVTPQPTPARFPSGTGPDVDKASQPAHRNDIAMLYSFIGLLYSALPPESALQFWGAGPQTDTHMAYAEYVETTEGKLPNFLQWAVWSTQGRDVDMSMALYDMLVGLAKGQQCSELAYNFMARGGGEVIPGSSLTSSSSPSYNGVSWTGVFGLLESWASVGATRQSPVIQQNPATSAFGFSQPLQNQGPGQTQQLQQHQLELGSKDVLLAQSFLRLLSTVVTHSVAVRLAISGNNQFRAIPTLVSLIPMGVPLELKGALFDTLAAFCEPGAGIPGVEICKAVWTLMERLEVINVRGVQGGGFGPGQSLLTSGKGVEVELEEVETVYKLYPATIPFLKLLSTLIHTPKRIPLKDRVVDAEPVNTTPETLGQPYRLPGIGPFVAFVVDHVFAQIPSREYLHPSDRWQTNDLCLCFIERALASYDVDSLVISGEDQAWTGEIILPLLVHPGYDITKRILTNSPLQASILSYIVDGVEGFEKHYAEDEPYFRSTIVRVLRIVARLLEIQDIFLDVLVPVLSEFDAAPIIGTVHARSDFTRLDQALSFGPQFVPSLAAYVAYPAYPELVLLSIKILTSLASSTAFPNLTAYIERSDDSDRILTGFAEILDAETDEDVPTAEVTVETCTGAGAPDFGGSPPVLEQAMRLAVLDLFIRNTDSGQQFPNIAHYILFGGTLSEQQIQDPHALGARRTCIHSILDLVNTGVPRLNGKGRDDRQVSITAPLFMTNPALAARCYRIIYQLCVHPRTSDFTMRYLRTRENFFARQLAAIPSRMPDTTHDLHIEVMYSDASRVRTTVSAFSSFLKLRSYIFDLVALDLHVLTNKAHHKGAIELLEILFGNATEQQNEFDDYSVRPFREVGQSYIIEFVQSLSFDWSDSLTVRPVDMEFLNQLNLKSCMRTDEAGSDIIDRTALLSLLTATKRALHFQGRVITSTHIEQLNAEMAYVLGSCAVENHRREIQHAVAGGYEAWRRLLDTTLTKCFQHLPHSRRENMLFDLLHVLPMTLCSPVIQESTSILLSEAILSAVTKLREDRHHQILIQSTGGDADVGSLPEERLYALLRSVLECILDNNHLELVRGNLYATLINYLHLIASADAGLDMPGNKAKFSLSVSPSMSRSNRAFSDNLSMSQLGQNSPSLEAGSLGVMKNLIERLVGTISRDAIDGTEVWKSVAFMTLDSLIQLSRLEKQHIVLSALVQHGILSNFVLGIKESDSRLQSVLRPDPHDLNPLYVYEAKMSLFIRMAQTRAGSERLLEAQVLHILAQCDYLDALPEANQSFMDRDSFLPSAIQRYHQLFIPALQVVDGMLASLGPKHATVANQTLEFLSSHRDTIVILLKSDLYSIPLSVVDEIHLLISLCTSVLPLVPKLDLVSSNTGFGAIHNAILGLAAIYLSNRRWVQGLKPQTDSEAQEASIYASGFGTETKFDAKARQKDLLLRKAITAYLGIASDFTEPEMTLVLSPLTNTQRHEDRSQVIATIPTIGDAIDALTELCNDLSSTLHKIADLSAELSSEDHLRVDNIQEIVNTTEPNFLQDLDIGQKRSLVRRELERVRTKYTSTAQGLLSTTEMLLLLLWRHLMYYLEGHHINNPDLKASTSRIMRFLPNADTESLRSELGQRLAPVLQRLASLDLMYPPAGDEWRSSQGWIEIMCRRLRDTSGLHELADLAVER